MINKIHFGKRIAILRHKVGLSQTDLAEKIGVTSQAISKWECGNAVPDIDILYKILHQRMKQSKNIKTTAIIIPAQDESCSGFVFQCISFFVYFR